MRYGDKVYEPIVEEGCADILIAFEKLEALRYAHFLKKEGILIVNDQRIDPMPVVIGKEEYPKDIFERLENKYDLVVVDALNEARKLGNVRVFNVIVLGIVSRYLGIEKEVWEKVIRNTVPVKTVDLNLAAFEIGRNISKEKEYD